MQTEDLIGLNRPEYPGTGENVLSSLAWSLVEAREDYSPCVYERPADGRRQRVDRIEVSRTRAEQSFSAAAMRHGIDFPDPLIARRAILNAFRGVLPAKANSYPVVPLVRPAAYLQDSRGVKGKKNPANYAAIIERFYVLGGTTPVNRTAAAAKWFDALPERESSPLLQTLSDIASASGPVRAGAVTVPARAVIPDLWSPPLWLDGVETPFVWFRQNWDTLCSSSWLDALPRRRWCDWASCIVRTALGLCFLWEAKFYRVLGQMLADDAEPKAQNLVDQMKPLLPWKGTSERVSVRDVGPVLRQTISGGERMRKAFITVCQNDPTILSDVDHKPLQTILDQLARSPGVRDVASPFRVALAEDASGEGPNTHETVVYSLLRRLDGSSEADFYSLLNRRSRRFLVLEPGQEWIVVLASLASGVPGQPTTLKQVSSSLSRLCLRPGRETLVRCLEEAGLAMSSHDADEALEVMAAF